MAGKSQNDNLEIKK